MCDEVSQSLSGFVVTLLQHLLRRFHMHGMLSRLILCIKIDSIMLASVLGEGEENFGVHVACPEFSRCLVDSTTIALTFR